MRVLFTVQGEGRGHLTQALAVFRSLSRQGHELIGVVAGSTGHRTLPGFFTDALPVDVTTLPSPGFVIRGNRSLNTPATLGRSLLQLPATLRSVRQLRAIARDLAPDLIVNFFEPLTGLAQLTRPLPAPVVSVAHQFMFLHPEYVWPTGHRLDGFGLRLFTRLVGWRSWKLALSLAPAADRPERRLVVGPPLLRPEVLSLTPTRGQRYLVYVVNHGYSEEIRAWHRRHPTIPLDCFYDRPGAPASESVGPNLTFHRLDGEKFLRLMAGCRAVACTAGFESIAEAAWLHKNVYVVPVEGHAEQAVNAFETDRLGLGVAGRSFDLDRLIALPEARSNLDFRAWMARAEDRLQHVFRAAADVARSAPGRRIVESVR